MRFNPCEIIFPLCEDTAEGSAWIRRIPDSRSKSMKAFSLGLMMTCLGLPAGMAQHAGDILIGRNEGMQLVGMNVPARTLNLPPASSGTFRGWVSSVLGFDGFLVADSTNNLFPVKAGANVFLELVTIDAGLSLRSFTAPAAVFADGPGERLRIGSTGNLHNHPIVFIDSAVVGTNFEGQRRVSFRLVDEGTSAHSASPVYTLAFAPIVTRLQMVHEGGRVTLSFQSREGLIYEVQSSAAVIGPWQAEGGLITGSGTLQTLSFASDVGARLFRVRAIPDN